MEKITIATHNGSFHADDVFAIATLQLALEKDREITVVRTRDAEKIATADIVVDFGGESASTRGRFDHHQEGGAGARDNGVPYASFGLVWKNYGEQVSGDARIATYLDDEVVRLIDAGDVGYGDIPDAYTVSSVIAAMNPTWDEDHNFDERFAHAVVWARELLEREIAHARAMFASEEQVMQAIREAGTRPYLVLDRDYAWKELVMERAPQIMFVVHPDPEMNGRWRAYTVRKSMLSFETRKPFPASWAAKRDADLERVSGVAGAIFCHAKRFMAVANSKAGAIALVEKALAG